MTKLAEPRSTHSKMSLITSFYARERISLLRKLLGSINRQSASEIETIVVVEDGSNILQLAEREIASANPPNPILLKAKLGSGAAYCRNLGAASASCSILGFVDDDVILSPGWVKKALTMLNSTSADALAGSAAPTWDDPKDSWLPQSMEWVISCTGWYGNRAMESHNMWTMNAAIRKDVFIGLGGFNTALGPRGGRESGYHYLAEDLEFSLRLRRAGHKILYVPEMSCLHNVYHEQVSMRHIINRSVWVGRERRILRAFGGDIPRGNSQLISYLQCFLLPSGPKHHRAMTAILASLGSLAIGYVM